MQNNTIKKHTEMTNNKQQTEMNIKELYSNIEDLIIRWNLDGYKTAGYLTRQIMELIGNVITKEGMIKISKNTTTKPTEEVSNEQQ